MSTFKTMIDSICKIITDKNLEDQKFEKREIELGLSDGIYAEVLSGITKKDKIKIWNKTEPEKEVSKN